MDTNPARSASVTPLPLTEKMAALVRRPEHEEDPVTRILEQQAAKIPSGVYLLLSLGSMGASFAFEAKHRASASRIAAHWSSIFLIFGLYTKLVKSLGSR